MSSDKLKQHIQKELENQGSVQPSEGHELRFEARLQEHFGSTQNTQQPEAKKGKIIQLYKAVASVAAIALIALTFYTLGKNESALNVNSVAETSPISMSEISPELASLESQLKQEIKVKQYEVTTIADQSPSQEVQVSEIMKYLKELEDQYALLEKDMQVNYADERIIQSMVQNYKLRIVLLEKLKVQLKKEQRYL
jgi:hypothetical protein